MLFSNEDQRMSEKSGKKKRGEILSLCSLTDSFLHSTLPLLWKWRCLVSRDLMSVQKDISVCMHNISINKCWLGLLWEQRSDLTSTSLINQVLGWNNSFSLSACAQAIVIIILGGCDLLEYSAFLSVLKDCCSSACVANRASLS